MLLARTRRCLASLFALTLTVAFAVPPPGYAGGPFEQIVGVGGIDASRLPLTQRPYAGVRCPRANSIACDRIGLAVWIAQRPTRLYGAIAGHIFVLHPPLPGPNADADYWQGSLQPAGMLRSGPTHVTPDSGHFYWAGRHPCSFWVRLTATYPHQPDATIRIRVQLYAGWG